MSKLVFCSIKVAKVPFYFKLTDINIYSIEELCYYIYNNIYSIDEKELNISLVKWLKEELQLIETAEELQKLIQKGAGLKSIIMLLLKSASYYTEEELDEFIEIINEIESYPKSYRQKLKADNFLKYKNYTNAIIEYENIIQDSEHDPTDSSFYGNVWHNMGVIHGKMMDYTISARCFLQAYNLNNNIESLKQYLYVIHLSKATPCNTLDEKLIQSLEEDIIKDIENLYKKAKEEDEYIYIQKALIAKEKGQITEYYRRIDKIISTWKKDYRHQTLR